MRNKYYLAIGIDIYSAPKQLKNAVGYIQRISIILADKCCFTPVREPQLSYDATRENILNELNKISTFIGPNDDLVIFMQAMAIKHQLAMIVIG